MKNTGMGPGSFRLVPAVAGIIVLLAASACATSSPSTEERVPRMTIVELHQKLESGADILVADARTQGEYRKGHITGAISAPLDEVEAGEWEPPEAGEMVFY